MNFLKEFFYTMRLGLMVLFGEWHWLFRQSLCNYRMRQAVPEKRQGMIDKCAAWRAAQLAARKPYLLTV